MKLWLLSIYAICLRIVIRGRYILNVKASKSFGKRWYDLISIITGSVFPDFQFMNYGIHHIDTISTHKNEKYQFQLYGYLIHEIVNSKDQIGSAIEIGCGRGGGSAYLAQQLGKQNVVGLDLSSKAIDYCKRNYTADNLYFIEGDAESIPFSDDSFDVVINVESSHCYPDFRKFLSEVRRVLKSGGIFLLADFRSNHQVDSFKNDLLSSGLRLENMEDITKLVIASLDKDSKRKKKIIQQSKLPIFLKKSMRHFAGCKGSPIYADFQNRKRFYYSMVMINV